MYGYNIVGQQQANYGGYPLAQHASTGMSLDEVKNWLEQETAGVKRKYLALGALALGLGYYGYTQGWFGGHSYSRSYY